MGQRELGLIPEDDEVVEAEIVEEGERQIPPPPNFAPPIGSTEQNWQQIEWLHHMRGYLADANFMITEMMGYVPQHKVLEYQQRQMHFQAALGAFDATFD